MKLRTNIKRFTYVSAGILLLGISMASSFFAYKPPSAAAAGSPGAAIINGFPNALCAPTLGYISPGTQELMSVLSNSGINGPAGAENQMDQAFVKYQGDQVAQDTFGALYYNLGAGKTPGINVPQQNVEVITFSGAQGATNNDVLCKQTLVFFRAASDRSSNNFYGVWSCVDPKDPSNSPGCQYGHGPQFKFVTATVNLSAKTLSFSIPGGVSATGANALTLGDPNKLLSNCNYFSSSTACGGNGGGTGAGGNQQTLAACIIAVDTQKGYNTCLATAVANSGDASYTDIAHISFDGQTYIAGKWSGPNIHYSLDSSSSDKDLAGLSPYFDVNMGNSQTAYNVSSTTSVSALKQLGDVLTRNNKEGVVGVSFHAGNYSTSVPTDMTGLGNIATYYPASKSIQLDFTNGYGSNESHYYGVYTRQTATEYVLESGGYSGCGTNDKPMFILSQDPSLPSVGSGGDGHNTGLTSTPTLEATWRLWANSTPCGYADITPVNVVVAPANTTPPSLNPGGTSGGGNSSPTCESSGFPLSWIVCSIINGLASAVDGIYSSIVAPYLTINTFTSTNGSAGVKQAWSDLRILGDVFLVVALLIIVFGESLGGGLIDAYTAKKALPKILIAAILINLSYYICAFLVDVFNVIGSGLLYLLVHPFTSSTGFGIQLKGAATTAETTGLGLAALVLTGWAVAAGGGAVAGVAAAALGFLWAFVLLPALLIFVAIVVTIFLRRALIIVLTILSPVAFALYCLPNTEKYFKKWWDAFVETLMVFPIIAVLFAAGKIAALVIPATTGGALEGFAAIIAVVALIIPLALIPFAFKLAGGILGKVHETLNNYGKRGHQGLLGNPNDPHSWRNRAKYKLGDKWTQARERTVAGGRKDGAGIIRRGYGRMSNYGNLQAKRSMYNKQRSEMLQSQIATGDDTNIRDLFIAQDADTNQWYRRMDMEKGADGKLHAVKGASAVYKDAAIGRSAHNKAMGLYGGDKSAVQDALYYEWKKTSFDPAQMNNLLSQYGDVLDEHHFNAAEGKEMGKAVGFRHQGQSLASKHSTFGQDANGNWGMQVNHTALAKEGGFNIGTYQWSNQDATSFDELSKGYEQTSRVLAGYGSRASDDTVLSGLTGDLAEYNGQSLGQIRNANWRISEIAKSTNPDQRISGTDRQIPATEGEGQQAVGYGGVSNAPVEVQSAARRLVQNVARINAAGHVVPDRSGLNSGS